MIQKSNEKIVTAGKAVILNPITVEGDFLIKSMAEEYPRALRCMKSIAKESLINLGRLYHYHELTVQPKPEYLINICCTVQHEDSTSLEDFERALFLVSTNYLNKNYPCTEIAIPEIKSWESNTEKQLVIEKLFNRYFNNLENVKISYYYAYAR